MTETIFVKRCILLFDARPEVPLGFSQHPIEAESQTRAGQLAEQMMRGSGINLRRMPQPPSAPEHSPVWISSVDVMYAHRKQPSADTIVSMNGSWWDETGYGVVEVGKDGEPRANIDAHWERAINTAGKPDAVGMVYWEAIPGTQLTPEELQEVVLAAARALLYVLLDRRLWPSVPFGPTLGPDGRPIKATRQSRAASRRELLPDSGNEWGPTRSGPIYVCQHAQAGNDVCWQILILGDGNFSPVT